MPPPIIATVAMFTRYFNFYAIFSVWHKLNTKQVGNSAVIFWQEKYWFASIGFLPDFQMTASKKERNEWFT